MRKYFIPLSIVGFILLLSVTSQNRPQSVNVDDNPYIQDLLEALGEPRRADNTARTVEGASLEVGRAVVLEGRMANGRRQSRHFVCTSCHNTVRETPDLQHDNPEVRLAYALEKDLPFLPGTTLFGAVDRMTYYNGDYEKKYGDLVAGARRDLRGAIQLCATECAQGRALSEVEMESVMIYLRNIGLRLWDLGLSEDQLAQVQAQLNNQNSEGQEATVEMIKSAYSQISPASFVDPPEDRRAGYLRVNEPDTEIGGELYRRSCLHCHGGQRYSFFDLDDGDASKNFLDRHFTRYTRYSVYQVGRYGTSPIPGKRAYMPHYTAERMSNNQMEDLRAYIVDSSNGR